MTDSSLTAVQEAFLEKRRSLVPLWRYAGAVMLLMILGFAAYLFVRVPLFINPFKTIEELEAGTLTESTLVILAAMAPVLFGAMLVLLLGLVAIIYAAIGHEKQYLAIIDDLRTGDAGSSDRRQRR